MRSILAAASLLALFTENALAQVAITMPYTPPLASDGLKASGNTAPNRQWANILGNSLYFYDIQRAGKLPSNFRVPWRNDSVPDDGKDVNIDLSGGYFDAGNYIKATLPLCWVLTQMAWSGLSFGSGYNAAAQTPYFDRALRQGLDWLLQASSVDGELVVIIGSEKTDNVYFGGDRNIPIGDRPAYKVTRSNPGTDVTASCAGALAAGAMLYQGRVLPASSAQSEAADLKDEAYAATLLARAQSLFDLARTATPQQLYQKAVPQVNWAYPSTDYNDELVLGGVLLAAATGQSNYSTYAAQLYSTSGFPVSSGALNWDSKAPALPVLFVQASLANPQLGINTAKFKDDAERYFEGLASRRMSGSTYTKGGLLFIKGDSDDATLNPAMNIAALAVTYSRLATSSSRTDAYLSWARSQLDYVLGKNPANVVYQCGLHPNSPQNPQSALATGSGSGDVKNIDTDPATERWVLYGGVVGGPARDDSFSDRRSDWRQTEVALDSVSSMLVLAAHRLAIGDTVDPYYVTLTNPRDPSGSGSGGLSVGAIVGIVVGVVLGLLLLLILVLAYLCRGRIRARRERKKNAKHIPLNTYD